VRNAPAPNLKKMSRSSGAGRHTLQELLQELQAERHLRDEAAQFGKLLLTENESLEEQLLMVGRNSNSAIQSRDSDSGMMRHTHSVHRPSHILRNFEDLQFTNSQLEEDYQDLLIKHHQLQSAYAEACNNKDKGEKRESIASNPPPEEKTRAFTLDTMDDHSLELDQLRDRVARMESINDDARDELHIMTYELSDQKRLCEQLQVMNASLCHQVEVLEEKHTSAEQMCIESAEREEEMMMRSTQMVSTMLGSSRRGSRATATRSRLDTMGSDWAEQSMPMQMVSGIPTTPEGRDKMLPRNNSLGFELLNRDQVDLEEEMEILRDELEAHKDVALELRREIERLVDLNDDLMAKSKVEDQKCMNDLSNRCQGMEARVSEWEQKFREATAEGACLRAELLEAQSQFDSFQQMAKDMADEVRQAHEAALNGEEVESCRLEDQLKTSTDQNSKLRSELMEAIEHSQLAEKNVTQLAEELRQECTRNSENSDTLERNSNLQAELAASAKESKRKVSQLTAELKQEETKRAEELELRTENTTLRNELVEATHEAKSLNKNVAELAEALKQDPDQRDHEELFKSVEAENAKLRSELNDSNHKSLTLQESLAELKEAVKKDCTTASPDGRHLLRFSSDSRHSSRVSTDTAHELKAYSGCMKELQTENAELRSELQAELLQVSQHSLAMQRRAEELSDYRGSISRHSISRSRQIVPMAAKVPNQLPLRGPTVSASAQAVLQEDPVDIFSVFMSIVGCSRTKPAAELAEPIPGKGPFPVLHIAGT